MTSSSFVRGCRGSTTDGRYFAYPLRAEDVVRRLGLVETVRCVGLLPRVDGSAGRSRRPTFEGWVTARFGRRLYDTFFRDVHREGVGDPRQRDPVGVGGAADPEPLVLDGAGVRRCACDGAT